MAKSGDAWAGGTPSVASRRAGATDVEIGNRIREARTERRVTQEVLAKQLGISTQQLQKYENGGNRISASRLADIARCLDMDVVEFFSDEKSTNTEPHATNLPTPSEIMELLQYFCAMENIEARRRVIDMAEFLANLQKSDY